MSENLILSDEIYAQPNFEWLCDIGRDTYHRRTQSLFKHRKTNEFWLLSLLDINELVMVSNKYRYTFLLIPITPNELKQLADNKLNTFDIFESASKNSKYPILGVIMYRNVRKIEPDANIYKLPQNSITQLISDGNNSLWTINLIKSTRAKHIIKDLTLTVAETILCSAIWYKEIPVDNDVVRNPINVNTGIVIIGYRHADCINLLHTFTGMRTVTDAKDGCGIYEQGFLTSRNRFVDRIEAGIIHRDNGFITQKKELYSEDLY